MSAERPEWTPTGDGDDAARCRNCGSHVLPRTPKVFGDQDDVLWHCSHCEGISIRDLKFGAGTTPDYDPATDRGQTSENMPVFNGGETDA